MIRTDEVRALLVKNKDKMSFEDIWANVKNQVISSLGKEMDESQVKSDLYMSLLEDEAIIMLGDNLWDLKEKYSLENLAVIERARMTEETELVWEETDDTKELKLSISYDDEDGDDLDNEDLDEDEE